MPESRYKYLYERLGDHDFQLLVNATLTHAFPDYRPLPLRQADGGRDGLVGTTPGQILIYQHKWSSTGREKDPVEWLDEVVRREADSLRRLASEGVSRYVLVTNVASTAKPGTGTFDRLNAKLGTHATAFGFEQMTAIWRESLDAFLDSAPTSLLWQYAEMLAGWNLIRYLINDELQATSDKGLRDLVRKVAATQWGEDELVKFSQSDVDSERVADLFIDVTADLLREAGVPGHPGPPTTMTHSHQMLGGAAAYLCRTTSPATLVRGAPGQGKSTLSQYLSQLHRAAFIPAAQRTVKLATPATPRFPLRFDLSEYTRWRQGIDVFDQSEDDSLPTRGRANVKGSGKAAGKLQGKPKRRPAAEATIECFLAELMTHASGGRRVDARAVQQLFDRVPSLVVLDGLDEVGSTTMRTTVVAEIDRFVRRGEAYPVPLQVVVTTRPSSNELPEPSADLFEVLTLNELTVDQRAEYLRKWCKVRGIRSSAGREMRRSFNEKIREPYIRELAGNPMQLTILLELIHERGAATATQRTELYDSYVDLLLAREANKHPESVRKHRDELIEIIPFLGWYLQSRSEESSLPGRMKVDQLQAAMKHFQTCYAKRHDVVDELFEAATDRLWALTSKTEGTYEFEVLSLREYFAAQFLYRNAGEETRNFDRSLVLRELLRRPYWLNTARFYGGNARGGELGDLADGILDEVADEPTPQARAAAWTLVTDGVFRDRPRQARSVIDALTRDDGGVASLLDSLGRNEVHPLPALPELPLAEGPDPSWTRLTSRIETDPAHPGTRRRVRAIRELLNQRVPFTSWWVEKMTSAVRSPTEHAWLAVAASCEGAAGVRLDLDGLDVEGKDPANGFNAALALDTGIVPTAGGDFEKRLVNAVLDGQCAHVTSIRSMPAQVAVALSPTAFYTMSPSGFVDVDERNVRRRADAVAKLRRTSPEFAKLAGLRRFKHGQKGSTFPWVNTASALLDHVGRCWLASEIAILGAASPFGSAFTRTVDAAAFGTASRPGEVLAQTRAHASKVDWWREQLTAVSARSEDDWARAEWTLALWGVAASPVIEELLDDWQAVLRELAPKQRRVVHRAAWDLAQFGWLRPRPVTATADDEALAQLLNLRAPEGPKRPVPTAGGTARPTQPAQTPLAQVARDQEWFKVDSVATYT